jgi:hypothetical protein
VRNFPRRAAALVGVAVAVLVTSAVAIADDPPTTLITAGPDGTSVVAAARFDFISTKPASFECSLDGAPFAACVSPYISGPLALGAHTFSVRAIGPGGELELTPPVRQWTLQPGITPPAVKLRQPAKKQVRLTTLRSFSGTASAPSGIKRVQVALAAGGPDKNYFPPRCNFFDLTTGKPAPQTCLLPRYFTATGTAKWRYEVPAAVRKRLKPGRYTLTVRAFNAYQQATQQRFELRLSK